jgi:hypothetical protein
MHGQLLCSVSWTLLVQDSRNCLGKKWFCKIFELCLLYLTALAESNGSR